MMHISRIWSAARRKVRIWKMRWKNAREAAYNWISLELEEEGDLPAQTHIDDMSLPEGSMVKQIMVRIKLLPDND